MSTSQKSRLTGIFALPLGTRRYHYNIRRKALRILFATRNTHACWRGESGFAMVSIVKSPRAFTLIEILVVVAIVGVLAAILLPVLGGMVERSRSAKCQSNLRQLGAALISYAGGHNGMLPGPGTGEVDGHSWMRGALNSYVGVATNHLAWAGSTESVKDTVFYCPAERPGNGPNRASIAGYDASSIPVAKGLGYGRNAIWAQAPNSSGAKGTEIDFTTIRIPNVPKITSLSRSQFP